MANYTAPTQSQIDDTVNAYRANGVAVLSTTELVLDAAKTWLQIGPFVAGIKPVDEKPIMLASAAKFGIVLALVQELQDTSTQVEIDLPTLLELCGRNPKHVLANGTYTDIRQDILGELREMADLIAKDTNIPRQKELKKEIETKLSSRLGQDMKVKVSVQELLYQILSVTSNHALATARNLVGTPEKVQQLVKKLIPHYEAILTQENFHHWVQDSPNVGLTSEFVDLLHGLVTKQEVSTGERMLIDSMTNNPIDFGFCFTHSELGQKLISQGWKIVEKTGYYPCVFWVRSLAKAGYPQHMVHATICSLIPPDGKEPITFGHAILTAVAPTPATQTINVGGQSLVFPEETEAYGTYSRQVKSKVDRQFRQNLVQFVKQQLSEK